jgi:hypothetical protein
MDDAITFCSRDLAFQRKPPLTPQEVDIVRDLAVNGCMPGILADRILEMREGHKAPSLPAPKPPLEAAPGGKPQPTQAQKRLTFNDWERRVIGKAIAHLILTEQITPRPGRILLQKLEAITKT